MPNRLSTKAGLMEGYLLLKAAVHTISQTQGLWQAHRGLQDGGGGLPSAGFRLTILDTR